MQPKMKALVGTLALAVTVVTAAACGDDDDSPDAATAEQSSAGAVAPADVAGSDQHLNNAAEELARQERVNAAATARLTAQAEAYEMQAHLEGQARTYGSDQHLNNLAEVRANETFNYPYSGTNTDAGPATAEAANRAAAEELERQAHLDGQARTYTGGPRR
jgi:hypothetical protein